MARGGKFVSNRSKKRKVHAVKKGSDDSDEDYVLGEDEELNESEESFGSAEYASEDSFENRAASISSDKEEEEEEEVRKVDRLKVSKPKKRSLDRKETRIRRRRVERSSRVSDDEEEDYDFDDEDDEEFDPDAADYGDEDEGLQVKRNNHTRKRVSRKRVSRKGKKRKRKSKVSKKPLKRKPKKMMVKRTMSSDDDFDVEYKAVPKKTAKKSRRGTKKMADDWDSDYACSGSSDLEYTVSDEQVELLREASKFCGSLRTCSRDSSLSKRSQDGEALSSQQLKLTRPKGKEKVLNVQNDLGKQICGICLSEEGKGTIQGTLNCCSHFFCFACIMEWSKVESRCPLCKQRFMTISKPARMNIGIDLRNMVIQVPKRDQVYQPSDEELRGYLDPYENVVCMECQLGGDDNLMLLCDICDSPAHTYCVGLGQEVPEGNWYCKGCRSSDPGSSNSPVPNSMLNQGTSTNNIPTDLPTHRTNPEGYDPTPRCPISVTDPLSHGIDILSSPRYLGREDVHAASPTGLGASTLSGRRRIRRQIHNFLSNNRTSQIAEMVGRPDGISYNNVRSAVENSEIKQFEEIAVQHAENFVNRGFQSAPVESWVQDADSCSVEDRIPISAILGHSQRLGNQVPSAPITNVSSGFSDELGTSNSIMGLECLYQYSRPLNRADDALPPSGYFHGEGTKERW